MSSLPYSKDYWSKKVAGYADEAWSNQPSPFAELAAKQLRPKSVILELGAGIGQDGLWFASQGHKVILSDATDQHFAEITERAKGADIELQKIDLLAPLPFDDNNLDVVYAHLVLHYFDDETMKSIIKEIERVLKPGGLLACMVNTQTDEEYDPAEADDSDIIEYRGISKRFFTTDSLQRFMGNFDTVLLDDQGRTPKDEAIGNSGMIQFIGAKRG